MADSVNLSQTSQVIKNLPIENDQRAHGKEKSGASDIQHIAGGMVASGENLSFQSVGSNAANRMGTVLANQLDAPKIINNQTLVHNMSADKMAVSDMGETLATSLYSVVSDFATGKKPDAKNPAVVEARMELSAKTSAALNDLSSVVDQDVGLSSVKPMAAVQSNALAELKETRDLLTEFKGKLSGDLPYSSSDVDNFIDIFVVMETKIKQMSAMKLAVQQMRNAEVQSQVSNLEGQADKLKTKAVTQLATAVITAGVQLAGAGASAKAASGGGKKGAAGKEDPNAAQNKNGKEIDVQDDSKKMSMEIRTDKKMEAKKASLEKDIKAQQDEEINLNKQSSTDEELTLEKNTKTGQKQEASSEGKKTNNEIDEQQKNVEAQKVQNEIQANQNKAMLMNQIGQSVARIVEGSGNLGSTLIDASLKMDEASLLEDRAMQEIMSEQANKLASMISKMLDTMSSIESKIDATLQKSNS